MGIRREKAGNSRINIFNNNVVFYYNSFYRASNTKHINKGTLTFVTVI